jgi:predicted small metal-binding protein
MQSLFWYPGRTETDELERMSLASVKCRDMELDCSFEARGTTEREVVRKFLEHLESEHDIPVLTADALLRLKKGIKKW